MWKKFIALAFLFCGLTLVVSKSLGVAGLGRFLSFYLLVFYTVGFLWSFGLCIKNRIIPVKKDILVGFGAGAGNFLGSFFMMHALNKISATVVFSIATGGAIITVAFFAVIIFKEKIGIRGIIGILSGTIGLILISI